MTTSPDSDPRGPNPAEGEGPRRRVTEITSSLDAVLGGLEFLERQARRVEANQIEFFAEAARLIEDAAASAGASSSDRSKSRVIAASRELAHRAIRAELATALNLSEHSIEARLSLATALTDDYPEACRVFESGDISVQHARVIIDAGRIIGPHLADRDTDTAAIQAENTRAEEPQSAAEVQVRRHEYTARVLGYAVRETPARLRPIARRLAEEYAETAIEERHRDAASRRRVCVFDAEDGMSDLWAHLPSVEAHAIHDRLTRMGRSVKLAARAEQRSRLAGDRYHTGSGDAFSTATADVEAADQPVRSHRFSTADELAVDGSTIDERCADEQYADGRGIDEIRADLLTDLLLASESTMTAGSGLEAIEGRVQVIVPVETLGLSSSCGTAAKLKADEADEATGVRRASGATPAFAPRFGAVPDTAARTLAGSASHWETLSIDPLEGDVLRVDRYRPSERMRRTLAARDVHCRFPGCRAPITRCDIDHTIDAAKGGATATNNLSHLCRGHHVLKHQTGWNVTQLPNGVLRWESPAGRVHTDRPPSRVFFRTAGRAAQSAREPTPRAPATPSSSAPPPPPLPPPRSRHPLIAPPTSERDSEPPPY